MSGAPYPDGASPSNGWRLPLTSFEKQRMWCSGTAPHTFLNGTAALATPLARSAPTRTPSSRPTRTGPATPLLIVLLDRTADGAGGESSVLLPNEARPQNQRDSRGEGSSTEEGAPAGPRTPVAVCARRSYYPCRLAGSTRRGPICP